MPVLVLLVVLLPVPVRLLLLLVVVHALLVLAGLTQLLPRQRVLLLPALLPVAVVAVVLVLLVLVLRVTSTVQLPLLPLLASVVTCASPLTLVLTSTRCWRLQRRCRARCMSSWRRGRLTSSSRGCPSPCDSCVVAAWMPQSPSHQTTPIWRCSQGCRSLHYPPSRGLVSSQL